MKNILLYVVMLGCSFFSLKAATITVDNNEDSSAQYTDLQDAIDDAQDGDTILVAASSTSYGGATLKKTIRLIGEGYKGDNITTLSSLTFNRTNSVLSSGGSFVTGFVISSISFNSYYSTAPSETDVYLTDIAISRCKISSIGFTTYEYYKYSNIDFYDNIITSTVSLSAAVYQYVQPYDNVNFKNNIFSEASITARVLTITTDGIPYINYYTNASGVNFEQNIFLNKSGGVFSSIRNVVVQNNIFYLAEPIATTIYQMDDATDSLMVKLYFNNNLQYISTQDVTETGYFGTGSNNQNADPLFEDYPLEGESFSYDHDYHLQSTSPAIGAGVNGEDLGIYDGDYPFEIGAQPIGPVMTTVEVEGTPSIPQGGSIQINFEAIIQE